jgi:hypothetical protein
MKQKNMKLWLDMIDGCSYLFSACTLGLWSVFKGVRVALGKLLCDCACGVAIIFELILGPGGRAENLIISCRLFVSSFLTVFLILAVEGAHSASKWEALGVEAGVDGVGACKLWRRDYVGSWTSERGLWWMDWDGWDGMGW